MSFRNGFRASFIAGMLIAGCTSHRPLPLPVPSPTTVALVPASQLQAVVPSPGRGYQQTLFLQRPGQVTYHIRRAGTLVAMLSLSDLAQSDPQTLTPFRPAARRFGAWPAIATAMGDGEAVLVAGRFRVELDSLTPALDPWERDRWLARVNLPRLAALASGR